MTFLDFIYMWHIVFLFTFLSGSESNNKLSSLFILMMSCNTFIHLLQLWSTLRIHVLVWVGDKDATATVGRDGELPSRGHGSRDGPDQGLGLQCKAMDLPLEKPF